MKQVRELYKDIITQIGEDPTREGLKGTPERAEEALFYLTGGYREDLDEIINKALFDSEMSEMVIVQDIELYSLLSKIARIIDYYARRLQIQERLTGEIAECIASVTNALGVAVVIEAKHLCMMMRGVEKQNSIMKTSVMLGSMREDTKTRAEFLQLIR